MWRKIRRLPYVSILVLIWAGLRFANVDMTRASIITWIVALAAVGVLMREIFRSLDISFWSFVRDQVLAVLTLCLVMVLVVRIWQLRTMNLVDWVVAGVAILDATLSPIISFSNALRNLQAGVDTPALDVHG